MAEAGLTTYLATAAELVLGDVDGADKLLYEAAAFEPQLSADDGDVLVDAIHRAVGGDVQNLKRVWTRAVTDNLRAEQNGAKALERLLDGNSDAFVARALGDPGFPFAEDMIVGVAALFRDKRSEYENLLARLQAETRVRAGDLDREVKKKTKMAEAIERTGEPVFTMTDTGGLWAKDELGRFTYVSQPFEALGHCRSLPDARGRTTDWGVLIRFRNADGIVCDEIISMERLHGELNSLCSGLCALGMRIEDDERPRRLLRKYLNHIDSKDRITLVPRTGWHRVGGQDVFALPDETISNGSLTEKVLLTTVGRDRNYAASGTLRKWQESVGTLARDHFTARLAVSTALASPLLYLVGGIEGGGVHFFGLSGSGKTTVTRMGASVWRSGANLPTWRSTANGLESASARASGLGFVLNEMGEAVSADEVGRVTYMVTNAVGKLRMRRDASHRDPLTWLLLFLSSGEISLEAKLAEGGHRPKAGQLVRLLDIHADRINGAFDDLGEVDPHLYAQQCERVAETHFGTAGPEFVRQLLVRGISGEGIHARVQALVSKWLPDGTAGAGQPARAATRFALIATAGELATEFGILPWSASFATEAAEWAFGQWYAARGGESSYERRQAVAQVKLFIENYGESRFDLAVQPTDEHGAIAAALDTRRASVRAGYRKGVGTDRRWMVWPGVWRVEVCNGFDPVFVARELVAKGMLLPGSGDNLQKVVKIGGVNHRFYVLTPKLLEDDG
jgi:uncharacterized protein (DUF927 family)